MTAPTTPEFVHALFGDLLAGCIEIRIIEDRKPGKVVERKWYKRAQELLDDLPRLLRVAEQRSAAIFYGVLARREPGKGTAKDALPGVVVWVDIDFKDFAGGEAEARARLARLPLPPTIVVCSGNGLHAYWLLREPVAAAELSELSRRLARCVGGDHAFDAARILRLPGTFNRKDPANPKQVSIETFELSRSYNQSEIDEALDLVGSGPTVVPVVHDAGETSTAANQLPARIAALIQQRKRIGLLFNGEGKPELGPDGKTLDRSSSGYDFSLVLALIKDGVRDQADLAAALRHRPDGAAKAKGEPYIQHTIRKALETVDNATKEMANFCVGFKVERVRLFNSNPARYEFTVDGVTFRVDSPELRAPSRFATAFMDAVHRIPVLPASDDWIPVVNYWLKHAEIVELPPDASAEPALIEAIERAIAELVVGDAVEDLDHGKAVQLSDGRRAFKLDSVLKRIRDDHPDADRSDVARVLRSRGYQSHSTTVGGVDVRVWSRA